jgi:hypothetical protein
MAMPPVHFAAGMVASSVVGVVFVVVRHLRRSPLARSATPLAVYLPLLTSLCGLLALAPELLAWVRPSGAHSPLLNLFFLHIAIREQPWLQTAEAGHAAFHLVAFLHLAAACGYVVYIRRGLPRAPYATEALARMSSSAERRDKEGYSRPSGAASLAAVVPLFLLGAAAAWLIRVEGPREPSPGARASGSPPAKAELRAWARLVRRRMRVSPGRQLGLVHALPWTEGQWLKGDLTAHATPSGNATLETIVERAHANGCDFVVVTQDVITASSDQLAAYATDLKRVRGKFHDVTILRGLGWTPAEGTPAVLIASEADEDALLAGLARQLRRLPGTGSGAPAEGALHWVQRHSRPHLAMPVVFAGRAPGGGETWDELFSWSNEVCLGIIGLGECRRAAPDGRWDPRVARVGGAWDQLLDRGFRLWGAAAASGFRDPKTHFWPGEHARTHVWCPVRPPAVGTPAVRKHSSPTAGVLAGLRAGCAWAEEGGIVRALHFELTVPHLERPARMGEVVLAAPGAEVSLVLTLETPQTARAELRVELISNFAGEPEVVKTFRNVRPQGRDTKGGTCRLRYVFPPAADNNGGLGFYVRARGRQTRGSDAAQCFYTNPIRVLVRDVAEPSLPQDPRRVAAQQRPGAATPAVRKHSSPKRAAAPGTGPAGVRRALYIIGLPRDVPVLQIETFQKRPGGHWRGRWSQYAAGRGPAIGGQAPRTSRLAADALTVTFARKTKVADDARLFFRYRATECAELTILLHTSLSREPYQLVRVPPDRRWTEFDLSLAEDFFAPQGAPERILRPAEVNAIEWRAASLSAEAGFYVTDFAVYRPTPSRRRDIVLRRLDKLAVEIRKNLIDPSPSPRWRERLDALAAHVAQRRAQIRRAQPAAESQEPPTPETLAAVEQELDGLFDQCRRLRLETAMARAFLITDPPFVVGLESATRRVSARNPAYAFQGAITSTRELRAAGGEAESFQIVVIPLWKPLHAVEVTWSDFKSEEGKGPGLPASALSGHIVGEVQVRPRADLPPERAGWTPDPLLPLAPFDVAPGSLLSVLLTVHVPPDLPPGDYRGTITVRPRAPAAGTPAAGTPAVRKHSSPKRAAAPGTKAAGVRVTLKLRRWDFALVGTHFPTLSPIHARAFAISDSRSAIDKSKNKALPAG